MERRDEWAEVAPIPMGPPTGRADLGVSGRAGATAPLDAVARGRPVVTGASSDSTATGRRGSEPLGVGFPEASGAGWRRAVEVFIVVFEGREVVPSFTSTRCGLRK